MWQGLTTAGTADKNMSEPKKLNKNFWMLISTRVTQCGEEDEIIALLDNLERDIALHWKEQV